MAWKSLLGFIHLTRVAWQSLNPCVIQVQSVEKVEVDKGRLLPLTCSRVTLFLQNEHGKIRPIKIMKQGGRKE